MMKNTKILFVQLLFLILFFPSIFLAQAPESMNYQAVIRDGSGELVTSQQVGLRIKILQGSASGTSVYEETYSPTTNAYGLVNLQMGTGTVLSGTFSSIDWGNGPYFVETAADVSGGTSYVTLSTTQFMSVPYAFYAKSSDSWRSNANTTFSDKKVSVGHTNELYPLSVQSYHDGTISRGIDVLRTDNSGTNMGVPMSFSLLNSNNQPFEFGKIVGRTQSNTSGAEIGSLSFQVADGTPWGQGYEQERMRIDNEMITINAENTANSVATLRLRGTNSNADHSQLVDMKSAVDGHVTSSKFTIATRNQGAMNDHFVIDSEGKVGIGTTSSPTKKLSVENDDGFSNGEHILANISRTAPTSGVAGLYFGYYADGTEETGGIVRSMGGLPLYLGTFSNKQLLTVGHNSNVGIGTNSPNSLLDVTNGYISLSGIGSQSGIVSNVDFGTLKLYCGPYTGNTSNGFWFRASDSLGQVNSYTDLFKIQPHDVDVVRVGVGTMSPQRNLHINDVMRLEPRPSAPSNPAEGDIYMDNSDHKLKYYNGTTWENVAGSSNSSNSGSNANTLIYTSDGF